MTRLHTVYTFDDYVIVNTWGGVFYRIYPHELPVESLKIAHEAEGRVRYF